MLAGMDAAAPAEVDAPVADAEVKHPGTVEQEDVDADTDAETDETEESDEQAETEDQGDLDEEYGELELESSEALGPKDLAAKLDAAPEVKAILEQHPELRDQMFANARLADQAKAYREVVGSPAEAKVIAEGHQTYTGLRDLIGDVKPGDAKSTQQVISAMLAQATLRDANGEVLKDEQGRPVTDGTIGRFLNNTFQMRLGLLEAQAKAQGDDETLAALDTIMERAGLRAPSSADQDEMSEELKTQKAQIAEERRQLDERKASEQQQSQQAHDERVFGRLDTVLDKQIGAILDASSGLTPFARRGAEAAIRKELNSALKKSGLTSELDPIERMPLGKERAQRHIATATRYINDYLPLIARPILSEAGATVQKTAAAKEQTRAARAEAAQSEIRGSQPAPKTPSANSADAAKQLMTELTTKLGHAPSTEEFLRERMTRGLAAAGAR